MGGIFGGGSMPAPPPPTPIPTAADPKVEETRRKTALAAQKRKGRKSTLLTGALGDVSEPLGNQKQLKKTLG